MAKIYLSATFKDLKPYRDAVYRILRMLRHDVVSMEDYVASDSYPLHKCLADVDACDIYVGLIGWRYGYIPDKDNPARQSITALEYGQAGKSSRPRLLFLADPSADWPAEFKDSETGEGDGGERVTEFRAELETNMLVSNFRTPDHLAGLVSVAVQRYLLDNPSAASKHMRVSVREVRRKVLEQRLDALLENYQAATEELAYTRSAVDEVKIKRQIERIEDEIAGVEGELEKLDGGL